MGGVTGFPFGLLGMARNRVPENVCVRPLGWLVPCARPDLLSRGRRVVSPFFPSSFSPLYLSPFQAFNLAHPPHSFVLRPFMDFICGADGCTFPCVVGSFPHPPLHLPTVLAMCVLLLRPTDTSVAFPWQPSLFVFVLGMYIGVLPKKIRLFRRFGSVGCPCLRFLP